MQKFFVGELGYEHDSEFSNKSEAEGSAIEHSIASGIHPVAIWNEHDDVLAVVIEGDIFEKRSSENAKQALFRVCEQINKDTRLTERAKNLAVAIVLNELSDLEIASHFNEGNTDAIC